MNAAEMDNEYGIDPDKIAMFGDGTGGYVTLASATLQDYNDIILNNAGEAIESFWYDAGDGSTIPMVIEAVNGDPEGRMVLLLTARSSVSVISRLQLRVQLPDECGRRYGLSRMVGREDVQMVSSIAP